MVFIFVFIIMSFAIGLIAYMYKLAHSDQVLYQEISFANFPDSFGEVKLFFISDIHRRLLSEDIVSEVKGKVDLVIIGGDLLEKRVPIERVEQNIKSLTEIGPTYFVWGIMIMKLILGYWTLSF